MVNFTTLLVEDTGDNSEDQATTTFAYKAGKTSRRWRLIAPQLPIAATDINDTIAGLLGYSEYGPGNTGRITRYLPTADPQFPWLFCTSVGVKGHGLYKVVPSTQVFQSATANFGSFTQWQYYVFMVDSEARPYPIVTDENIQINYGTWYDETNTKLSIVYYPEWERFCDYQFIPIDDYITQTKASSRFVTGSGTLPGAPAPDNGAPFSGQPRVYIPNQIFKLWWTGVPLRYVTSQASYLNKWKGRVNQNAWNGPLGNTLPPPPLPPGTTSQFPPGSLLYMSYKVEQYSPPVPVTYGPFVSVIDYSKLCNLELTFLYTTRGPGTDLPTLTNNNYVTGGHNLMLYFPYRKYYMAMYFNDSPMLANAVPMYLSFPIEQLFSDPDVPLN